MIYILTSMYPPYYGSYEYPSWAIVVGWVCAWVTVAPVFIGIVCALLKQSGSITEVKKVQKLHWLYNTGRSLLGYCRKLDVSLVFFCTFIDVIWVHLKQNAAFADVKDILFSLVILFLN